MRMTREEAIEVLKDIVSKPMLFSNHIIDACRVALASLEAENDLGVDCIDRQTAITFVCKNTEEILKDTMPLEVKLSVDYLYENVAKIMRNPKVLPSVTPQEPINSVLEDIKAKLNEFKSHYMPSSGVEWGIKMCLEIIDKYKAESEET